MNRFARLGPVERGGREVRVRDVMAADLVTVPPNMAVGDFVDEIASRAPHRTYPVVADGAVLGLFVVRSIAAIPRRDWDRTKLRDCMLPAQGVAAVDADAKVADVLVALARRKRALVLHGDAVVGLITLTDAARAVMSDGVAATRW